MPSSAFPSQSRSVRRRLDPGCLAAGERLEGAIGLRGMRRLHEAAGLQQGTDEEACFQLECNKDTQGGRRLELSLQVSLQLLCQRCLTPMRLSLERCSRLGVVSSLLEARRLPDDCEPVEADADGGVDLPSLIEEEILLSIPLAPMHKTGCTTPGCC